MEPLCIVDAKAIYRLHTANHITLMWCQEMIYENGSLLSLSRARPGWTRRVDTKPARSRKQELADLSFITSQWVLFPAPDGISAARFSPRSVGDFARFLQSGRIFQRQRCFVIMTASGDASQLLAEKQQGAGPSYVWTHLSSSCIMLQEAKIKGVLQDKHTSSCI